MRTICVVPYGKAKIWDKLPGAGPRKAREVYVGPFAKKCREYAEAFYGDGYVILSAKYGFLWPEDIVPENYEVTFKKKKTNPISLEALQIQAVTKGLYDYYQFVVVAGKDYVDIVRNVFSDKRLVAPLARKNLFEMMGEMNEAIHIGVELD